MWKKIALWVLGVLAALAGLAAVMKKRNGSGGGAAQSGFDRGAEFERKAEDERQAAADRIRSAPERAVAERYDGVCDAVVEGRNRFAARLKGELDEGGGGGLD